MKATKEWGASHLVQLCQNSIPWPQLRRRVAVSLGPERQTGTSVSARSLCRWASRWCLITETIKGKLGGFGEGQRLSDILYSLSKKFDVPHVTYNCCQSRQCLQLSQQPVALEWHGKQRGLFWYLNPEPRGDGHDSLPKWEIWRSWGRLLQCLTLESNGELI